jgi:hypothetical protein
MEGGEALPVRIIGMGDSLVGKKMGGKNDWNTLVFIF